MRALMNRMYHLLFRDRVDRSIRETGSEVARACRTRVYQRVAGRLTGMQLSEIRGYARAHARELVENKVDTALKGKWSAEQIRSRLVAEAIEQVISMVIHDLLHAGSDRARHRMAA